MKTIRIWEHKKPSTIEQPDFTQLITLVKEYVDEYEKKEIEENHYIDDDLEYYIFEAALQVI